LNFKFLLSYLGLTWYLVHNKESFRKLKSQVEKNNKILNKLKKELRKDDKKKVKLEKDIRIDSAKLAGMRFYSLIALAVIMFIVYRTLQSIYDGVAVAKLPFEPISIFRRWTHMGVKSDDFSYCGMVSIFSVMLQMYLFTIHF